MRTFSRLELFCLVVILLIAAVIFTVMITRNPASMGGNPPQTGAEAGYPAHSTPGMTTASAVGLQQPDTDLTQPGESDPSFSERAQHIPRPSGDPGAASASGPTSALPPPPAPPAKTAIFGTNEVMQALQKIASMPWSAASEQLLQETLSRWAVTDPTAALQYALQIESRRVRASLVNGIFSSWAKTDATGAFKWLLANKELDPGTFQAGLKPVFTAMAKSHIPDAMHMALALSPGTDQMAAMRIVMEQAARIGAAPSMLSYMESLQTPGERQTYATALAQNWAVYAPEEAARWALSLTDPALQKAALTTTMGTWAGDNPQAAAHWILSMPDSELRVQQIAQITQSWARYDPVKAADWLLTQRPPAPGLDPAVQGLVNVVMRSNPEGAVMWAATISDPKVRNNTIYNVSREWMKKDPAKATAYILNAPLSPAQRARLLKHR